MKSNQIYLRYHERNYLNDLDLYEGRLERISLLFWQSVTLSTDSWESSLSATVDIYIRKSGLQHFDLFILVFIERSLTCTVCTCGDWMTEGWAVWITPWTWTVCPLGNCSKVTVGLPEDTCPAAMDACPHNNQNIHRAGEHTPTNTQTLALICSSVGEVLPGPE